MGVVTNSISTLHAQSRFNMTFKDGRGRSKDRMGALRSFYCNLSYSTPFYGHLLFVAFSDQKQRPLAVRWCENVTAVSMSATPSRIAAVAHPQDLVRTSCANMCSLTMRLSDQSQNTRSTSSALRSLPPVRSMRNNGLKNSICRARWCCCGIAPMVTDDATFHGLSLHLHPHFLQHGLGIRSLEPLFITIFFI